MKKNVPLFLLVISLMLNACTPQAAASLSPTTEPATPPAAATAVPLETQTPAAAPTEDAQPVNPQSYTNSAFGLRFQYPSGWFGPEETISEQTLRVEVGSDVVYPYGERPEQPSAVMNSYNVVIQYTQNNQNPAMDDTYQSLLNLKDGESLSGVRSLIIRVRQLELGRFKGFEYIFTLPETAQTSHVYGRQVILYDEKTNDQLTMMGQPDNVEVGEGMQWRDVYRSIDEANLASFHDILDSMTIE